jgi:hypothetical protein
LPNTYLARVMGHRATGPYNYVASGSIIPNIWLYGPSCDSVSWRILFVLGAVPQDSYFFCAILVERYVDCSTLQVLTANYIHKESFYQV